MARKFSLAALALCVASAGAFAPSPMGASRTSTSLMAKAEGNNGKRFAATAIASAYLLGGIFATDAAIAAPMPSADFDVGGSSTVLAGRSGGRAGGRSRAAPRPSAARPAPSQTVIKKTTVVQPGPSVVVAPPMGGGYGYGYGGGFGGPGVGTYMMLDAIGDGLREGRQNAEIRETKRELENERNKEMEMEQRLRMLEQQQQQQQMYRQAPPPMMQPQQ